MGTLDKAAIFTIHARALRTIEGAYLSDDPCPRDCGYVTGFGIADSIKDRPEIVAFDRNLGLQNQTGKT